MWMNELLHLTQLEYKKTFEKDFVRMNVIIGTY